ncbi:MAG: hypothetical protein HUU19_12090 [Phycisphaerales bacterium]|nr:hypothetical protein [Phycisphaerales bacterium]
MLTQDQLAFAAGISTGNYRRIESLKSSDVRRTTAMAILGALERVRPLTREELAEFLRFTGLTEFAAVSHRVADAQMERMRPAMAAVARSLANLNDPAVVEVHQALDALIQRVGVLASMQIISAVRTALSQAESITVINKAAGLPIADVPEPIPETPREFDVVHPPVVKDGYVEQKITTYEAPPPAPPAAAAQRKKRSS